MNLIYSNGVKNAVEKAAGLYYDNFSTYEIGEIEFGAWKSDVFEGDCVNICKAVNANLPQIAARVNGQSLNSGGIPGGAIGGLDDFSINAFPLDLRTRRYWRKIRLGFHVSIDASASIAPVQFGFGFFDIFGDKIRTVNEVEWNFQGFFQKTNAGGSAGLVISSATSDVDARARTSGQAWGGSNMVHKLDSDSETFVQTNTTSLYPIGVTGYTSFPIYVEVDRGLEPDELKIFLGTGSGARGKSEEVFKEQLQGAYNDLVDGVIFPLYSYQGFATQGDLKFMSHFGMISNGQGMSLDAVGYQVIEELPTPLDIITGAPESSIPLIDGDDSAPNLTPTTVHFKFTRTANTLSYRKNEAFVKYRNAGETEFQIMPCGCYIGNQLKYTDISVPIEIPVGSEIILVSNLTELELADIEQISLGDPWNFSCNYAGIGGVGSLKMLNGYMDYGSTAFLGTVDTLEYVDLASPSNVNWNTSDFDGIFLDPSAQTSLKSIILDGSSNQDFDLSLCTSLERVSIVCGNSITAPNSSQPCSLSFKSNSFTFADISALVTATYIQIEGTCSGDIDIPDSSTLVYLTVISDYLNLNYNQASLTSLSRIEIETSSESSLDVSGFTTLAQIRLGHTDSKKPIILPSVGASLNRIKITRSSTTNDLTIYPNLRYLDILYCDYAALNVSSLSLIELYVQDSTSSISLCSTITKLTIINTGDLLTGGLTSLDASGLTGLKTLLLEDHNLASLSLGISISVSSPNIKIHRCTSQISVIKTIIQYVAGLKIIGGYFSITKKGSDGREEFWNPIWGPYELIDNEIRDNVRDIIMGRLWIAEIGYFWGSGVLYQIPFPYDSVYDPSTRSYNAVDVLFEYDLLPV